MPPYLMYVIRSRQALKLHLLGLSEVELAPNQGLQQGGHENLFTPSLRRDTGRQEDGLADEVRLP